MYKIKHFSSNSENIRILREYRKYFGYAYPIEPHHKKWYDKDVNEIIEHLNRECSYLCMPFDTACRELIGLAIHKMLLSKNKKCQKIGIKFAEKYMNFYYKNHKENSNKIFRLLEDMSYIADTLEFYKDDSNESFLQ